MMILQGILHYITARCQFINDSASRHLEHVHSLLAGPSLSSKLVSEKSCPPVIVPRSPPRKQLVWLITGTSTGFGRRLVRSALLRGDRVIATVRSLSAPDLDDDPVPSYLEDNLRRIELDVTEGEDSLKVKVDAAAAIWGRIDVLVNNAGQGLVGLSEEGGSTLFRKAFDVNVFGLVDMTTVSLPHLRESQGCIVNIGSRSAWKTEILGVGPYSASKAAVHALSETLATEVAPFNVRVLLVAPGAFRTEGIHSKPFFEERPISAYDSVRRATAQRFSSISGTQKGDPPTTGEALLINSISPPSPKDFSMSNDVNTNFPRNSLTKGGWWFVFILGGLTWGLSVASIGLAASGYVRYNRLKNNIAEAAAPAIVEVTSPDLLPTGIVVLSLSCVLCFILMTLFIHLLLHRWNTRKPATSRGFYSVPTYYWAFNLLLSVIILFSFVAVGTYVRFMAWRSIQIQGQTPSGQVIPPSALAAFFLETTGKGLQYDNFGFLKNVGILPWFMNVCGLVLMAGLYVACTDAASLAEATHGTVSSSRGARAAAVPATTSESVPTAVPETEAAVDSSSAAAPVVTREKDGTGQDVATKAEEPNTAESTVTPKDSNV
ncbi:hypothetical protein MD484_g4232, partial [Candolleomyces efflorescens]